MTVGTGATLGKRITVVGTTGSGKTVLAATIARLWGFPHVELDALYWGPDWTETSVDVFRQRVACALSGDYWVADGNYGKVRDIVWSRAETVVWLDYALPVIMGRLLWRTLRRSTAREELWSGNREKLSTALLSRDSILLWALRSFRRRRTEYPALLNQPEYARLRVLRLRSPRATRAWLANCGAPATARRA